MMKTIVFILLGLILAGCTSTRVEEFAADDGKLYKVTFRHHVGLPGAGTVTATQVTQRRLLMDEIHELEEEYRVYLAGQNEGLRSEDISFSFSEDAVETLRDHQPVEVDVSTQARPGLVHDIARGVVGGAAAGVTGGLVGDRGDTNVDNSSSSNAAATVTQE